MSYTANRSLESLFAPEPLARCERRIIARVGEDLQARVKRHTPIAKPPPGAAAAEWLAARKRRPGHLRDSWKVGDVEVVIEGELLRIAVYTLDPVAPHVEWNTAPHVIASPDGMLRFWDKRGRKVFAKVVHHPGTRGVHMMATSLVEVAESWKGIARDELRQWAREQVA